MWGAPPDEPADGMLLKIRLPDGAQLVRKFSPAHTLRDLLATVHASAHRLDPTKQYKLTAPFGITVSDASMTLEAAGVQRGAYNLSEC